MKGINEVLTTIRVRSLAVLFTRTIFRRFYQRTLRWVGLDELPGVVPERLHAPEEVPTPEAPDAPFLANARRWDGASFALPEARAAVLRDVFYAPDYQIVFPSRHQVLVDTVNGFYPFGIDPQKLYGCEMREVPGWVSSFRARWNNYYHTLIDVFPRLTLLHLDYFRQFEEIKLLCPGGLRPIEALLLDKLELPANVRVLEVDREVLYRPERYLHISYVTRQYSGYVPAWYRERVREKLLPKRPSRRTQRILISRQNAKKRRILNFDALAEALAPLGFRSYELGEMPFLEQVELFYDADVVVGAHGAGLTNVLFSDHARVLELFPSWYVLPHYYYLCQSLGHPYRYCLATELERETSFEEKARRTLRDLPRYNDVHFEVDVERVLRHLHQLGVARRRSV